MKYMICVLLTLLSFSLFAVIRTVDNNSPSAGQYTTIQAAINASNAGDTVYVYPSFVSYAGFTVDRKLSIYGTRWNTVPGQADVRATQISGQVGFSDGSSYSEIIGFGGGFTVSYGTGANNLRIDCCSLSSIGTYYSSSYTLGMVVQNCKIVGSVSIDNSQVQTQMAFINCIIESTASPFAKNSSNISIINSVFKTTAQLFSYFGTSYGYPSITNSYFMCSAGQQLPQSPAIKYNMASSGLFIDTSQNLNNVSFDSAYTADYHHFAGSVLINAGDPASDFNDLDGSRNDIGVYGGPYPYDVQGFTSLPTITDVSGTLYTSPSQGLQIHVEASSRH